MKVSIRNKYYGPARTDVKTGGFTIVELLVVIVIIGILATLAIVSYTGISQKAIAASLQSDLSGAKNQLALYYVDHGAYPTIAPTKSGDIYCTDDSRYCYKASLGNTIGPYTPAVGGAPQTYSIIATSTNNTKYSITNNSIPIVYNVVVCTGGIVSTDGLYTVHKFTSTGSSSLTCDGSITGAEVLIVAGGGGGRSNALAWGSGGGGAGGLIASTVSLSGTMAVVVGSGGVRDVGNGGNSSFAGYTAIGGGMGGSYSPGNSGGSGGGGSWNNVGGTGTSGQGYNGAAGQTSGGGGGGAGESGGLPGVPGGYPNEYYPGKGGAGINSDIVQDGVNVGYAGGGGGGARYGTSSTATHGGGYSLGDNNATSGTANTGGGGGGGHQGYAGGSGGTGIVIVRYLTQ